jgi:hypothetical protein
VRVAGLGRDMGPGPSGCVRLRWWSGAVAACWPAAMLPRPGGWGLLIPGLPGGAGPGRPWGVLARPAGLMRMLGRSVRLLAGVAPVSARRPGRLPSGSVVWAGCGGAGMSRAAALLMASARCFHQRAGGRERRDRLGRGCCRRQVAASLSILPAGRERPAGREPGAAPFSRGAAAFPSGLPLRRLPRPAAGLAIIRALE